MGGGSEEGRDEVWDGGRKEGRKVDGRGGREGRREREVWM